MSYSLDKTSAQWVGINPSKLRHKVQIQARSAAQDESGQELDTWTTIASPWSAIETVTQNQNFQQSQITAEVTHTVTIRYTAAPIVSGMRVLYGARIFKIQTRPDNVDERNLLLILHCLEIAGLDQEGS
jgi:SPP1 family predicted phage head-tail adaptor